MVGAMLTRGFIPISTQSSALADQRSLPASWHTPTPRDAQKQCQNSKHKTQSREHNTTQNREKHKTQIDQISGRVQLFSSLWQNCDWKHLKILFLSGFCRYQGWLRWDLSNCGKSKKFVGRQLEVCDGTPWYRGSNRSLDIDLLSRAEHRNWLNAEFSWDLKNWQFGIGSNFNT